MNPKTRRFLNDFFGTLLFGIVCLGLVWVAMAMVRGCI